MGRPVVVSRHPPFPDLVSDQLGRIVDEGDPVLVANVLDKTIGDRSAGMTEVCRRHVNEHFSWARIAESVVLTCCPPAPDDR